MSARLAMILAAALPVLVSGLAAQQSKAPTPTPTPAPAAGQQKRPVSPRVAAQASADSAAADSATMRIEYRREVYNYRGGARDPFESLVRTADVGPTMTDLRLVSIAYDARGGRSVAVVRQTPSNRVHRLTRGSTLGRLRVIQIRQYEVVFQVEEFGFERQETLTLHRPEASRRIVQPGPLP